MLSSSIPITNDVTQDVFYINFVVMVNFHLELKNAAASFEIGFCDGIMLL